MGYFSKELYIIIIGIEIDDDYFEFKETNEMKNRKIDKL